MSAQAVIEQVVQPILYGTLTVLAFVQWRRHPGRASAWLCAAFGTLGFVVVASLVIPEESDSVVADWAGKLLIAVLVFFPYFLYRFMQTFVPRIGWIHAAVTTSTLGLAATALVLPPLPSDPEIRPWWLQAFITALLSYWVLVTLRVVVRLWRAGTSRPSVARWRMRTMSLGAGGLALALVVAGEFDAGGVTEVAFQVLVLTAGPLMLVGFAPPYPLRSWWRRHEDVRLKDAELVLVKAGTTSEVAETLLSQARAVVGAPIATLESQDGREIARDADPHELEGSSPQELDRLEVPVGTHRLVILTDVFMPFFGREEMTRLEGFAALADLVLTRNGLLEELRRAQREAEAANASKTQFLSRMSHELRTPLNAILGFAQLLDLDDLSPDQSDSTQQIIRGGRRLLQLINEVLDISRIESGQLVMSIEAVPLADTLRSTVELIRPLAAERSLEVVVDVPEGEDRHVLADRQRLDQILLNLLSNAVKYNVDHGKVIVHVAPPTDGSVRVAVRDTGPGVPDEDIDRLFAPFDRLQAQLSGVEGTGLGLTLSKNLAEAMGGRIDVDSHVGSGTTFWLELRKARAPAVPEEVPDRSEDRLPHVQDVPRKLLYIEDNLSNRRLIERVLERRPSVTLLPAMTGNLGLDLARQHVPNLILLDIHLPDLEGAEVLARLKKEPKTAHIPVVILSADASPTQIERLVAAGAERYLTKPIDLSSLIGILDLHLFATGPSGR